MKPTGCRRRRSCDGPLVTEADGGGGAGDQRRRVALARQRGRCIDSWALALPVTPSNLSRSAMKLRFDRGTIVLADPPTSVDLAAAPRGSLGPSRPDVSCTCQQVHAAQALVAARGILADDIPPRPRSRQEAWSEIDLRSYQEAALTAWEFAHRRGVIALPTGSGKTRLALAAMQRT